MQMKQEGLPLLRQIMDRFPKVTIILDHLARAPFEDGPPYSAAAEFFELAKYKQVFLKITPSNWGTKKWGKGTPETFFGKVVDTFGASRVAWGSNFPNSPGTLKEILGAARQDVLVCQGRLIRTGFSARLRSPSILRWRSD